MTLATNIANAFTRVGTEFKAVRTLIGGSGTAGISALTTTDKSSLVAAINEAKAGNAGSPPDASTTTKGIIEIATLAEVTTGTDTTRAVTPQGVKQEIDLVKVDGKLAKASNLSDLADIPTARTNLGLGSAATTAASAYDAAGTAAAAQAAAIAAAATDATTKADAKVADAINDGTTTVAPSQNAVFDALALLVPKSTVTTKGDILVATANDTVARKAVGADGTALLADSTQADGTRWGFTFIHKRTGLQASSYGMPGVTVTNYNSQTGTVGRNQLWLLPFLVLRPLQITAMARRNITAITVSDATVRCGIYATDANQAPSGAALVSTDLLFPSGTASGTTVANVVSLDLQPGLYYEAHNHTGGHDVSWAAWIVSDLIGTAHGVPSAGGKAGLVSWQSLAYGALPSSPTLPASMVRDDYSTFFQWSLL